MEDEQLKRTGQRQDRQGTEQQTDTDLPQSTASVSSAGGGSVSPLHLADIDAQQQIMARVNELMEEAAQTGRATKQAADQPARPFWAQSRVDIPPSETFGKAVQMSDDEQKPAIPQPHAEEVTENVSDNTARPGSDLSAIRDEVMSHMGTVPVAEQAELHALSARLDAMEGRIDKHQQDLTALLKLVRQLAAKKDEKSEAASPRPQHSGWGGGIVLVLLMIGGVIGWLFWMSPELMMDILTSLTHDIFSLTIQILAQLGVL